MTQYCNACDVTGRGMNEGWHFEYLGYYTATEEATIQIIREHYPQYKDISDDKVIEAVYEDENVYWTDWWDECADEILEQGFYYTEEGKIIELK